MNTTEGCLLSEQLAEIAARAEAATPHDLQVEHDAIRCYSVYLSWNSKVLLGHARSDILALLAHIRAMEEWKGVTDARHSA